VPLANGVLLQSAPLQPKLRQETRARNLDPENLAGTGSHHGTSHLARLSTIKWQVTTVKSDSRQLPQSRITHCAVRPPAYRPKTGEGSWALFSAISSQWATDHAVGNSYHALGAPVWYVLLVATIVETRNWRPCCRQRVVRNEHRQ
jgi:hypothetical protein